MGTERIIKNHMDILWHEYTDAGGEERPVTEASLTEKASIVGRVGIMLLSCGTGAWRVRSSMNALAEEMGITCTADIGLMSIEYTCFDGDDGFTQSLCLTNTGVNTSKLNRLEHFIREFEQGEQEMSGENEQERIEKVLALLMSVPARILCEKFHWKGVRDENDHRSKLLQFSEAVVAEVNRICGDENADIRKYRDETYELYGVKYEVK